MSTFNKRTCVILMLGMIPAALPAQEGDKVVAQVTACRAIQNSERRLACFDRAVAALESARTAKSIVVMDQREIREKKKSLFGLNLPAINLFGRDDDKQPEIAEIESKVVGLATFGRDRWTVRLADGSIWRTTETARFDPEQGDTVVIRRAALGTFRGSFKGARSIRMQRVE